MTENEQACLRDGLLAPELKEFYDTYNIELSGLLNAVASSSATTQGIKRSSFSYRFVRLNPRYNADETLQLLRDELKNNGQEPPIRVPWLPDDEFYALPDDFALSSSTCFQSGRIYGMDVSSGAAVSALLSSQHDKDYPHRDGDDKESSAILPATKSTAVEPPLRVLDLCCCPGLKLCAIADRVPHGSTVIGVDVSEPRMALCSKIVQKYHIESSTSGRQLTSQSSSSSSVVKIQLYCQDGTTFGNLGLQHNLVFDSRVALEDNETRGTRKRRNKSARAREQKRLKQIVTEELSLGLLNESPSAISQEADQSGVPQGTKDHASPIAPFDLVLVDAECSTDGSLKHLRERLKEATSSSHQESNEMLTDKDKLADLLDLQRRLIATGYRLLKPGGKLVYSTCSLSQDQNEKIVQWLLDENKCATLIPVEFSKTRGNKLVREGTLKGTIRFYPNLGQDPDALFGDGFFVAKIEKRAASS